MARSPILPTGPREPRSTVLSIEDEAIIVAFRRHTLLPLDDCLYALQDPASDPILIASLPAASWDQPSARGRGQQAGEETFKRYPIGYFHIDIAELQMAEGKLYLFVAIASGGPLVRGTLAAGLGYGSLARPPRQACCAHASGQAC
jgi:hypothetical protein